MSTENLEQFMSKVADSEELQAKIGEEIDAEALIALGAECGCEFTGNELTDYAEREYVLKGDIKLSGGSQKEFILDCAHIRIKIYVVAQH